MINTRAPDGANKLTYFDLFYYFIKGKSGQKFSHLLTVSLTVKRLFFTTPLTISQRDFDYYDVLFCFEAYRSLLFSNIDSLLLS